MRINKTSISQNMGGVRICLVERKRRKPKTKRVHQQKFVTQQQRAVVLQKQQETQQSLVAINPAQQELRLNRNIIFRSNKKGGPILARLF